MGDSTIINLYGAAQCELRRPRDVQLAWLRRASYCDSFGATEDLAFMT